MVLFTIMDTMRGVNRNAFRPAGALSSMFQVAGFSSGIGAGLLGIHDRGPGGASVSVVVSDREAPVIEAASERGIPTEMVSDDAELRAILDAHDPDVVCLDGFIPEIPAPIREAAPVLLNAHRSLLPGFPTDDPVGDALSAGVRVTGVTVHAVTDNHEPIITQEPVAVYVEDTKESLAERIAWEGTARAYPRAVRLFAEGRVSVGDWVSIDGDTGGEFPARRFVSDDRVRDLRYGENPHQSAALYGDSTVDEPSVVGADQINEGAKALSYNNYNDADAALNLIKEFDQPAAAVIKHTNPAGCAVADTIGDAYDRALRTDPMSAFGGIVALNRVCDVKTARHITESFKEVVIAPGYSADARDTLCAEENLRVLDIGGLTGRREPIVEKPLVGGRLVQERDAQRLNPEDLEIVTEREPTDEQVKTMLFAWQTIKHVKSNAILFATGTETVGIGMGQVSRVDAVRIAAFKARDHAEGKSPEGAVMASDAFFPFPDGIERAVDAGITAVIQPGGSVNDEEVIAAANEHGIAMAFTGQRCFRHD